MLREIFEEREAASYPDRILHLPGAKVQPKGVFISDFLEEFDVNLVNLQYAFKRVFVPQNNRAGKLRQELVSLTGDLVDDVEKQPDRFSSLRIN